MHGNRSCYCQSLFDELNERHNLGLAVDKINNRFGKNAVYVAAGHGAKNAHEEKIAFTKTGLFREGGPVDPEMQLRAQQWRERVLRRRRIG